MNLGRIQSELHHQVEGINISLILNQGMNEFTFEVFEAFQQ